MDNMRSNFKKQSKKLEDSLSLIKVENDGLSIYFGYMGSEDLAAYQEAVKDVLSCLHELKDLYDRVSRNADLEFCYRSSNGRAGVL